MGNMSYCRFENTSSDLYEVVEVMWDVLTGNSDEPMLVLSESELMSFHQLAVTCNRYLEMYAELVDTARVITDVEYRQSNEFVD